MTETKRRRRPVAPEVTTSTEAAAPARDPEGAERALGRAVAVGLPLASVIGAVVVGFFSSVGSALLVLAAGALLGTIALLWASVRTLTGDAPLPAKLEEPGASTSAVDPLEEEKRRVLRALKDLESEHAIGRIDDADYAEFVARYRADAKAVMREIDSQAAPSIAEAERVAQEYLEKRGLAPKAVPVAAVSEEPASPTAPRQICDGCGTSNEPDAAFCKKCGATVGSATEGDDASA